MKILMPGFRLQVKIHDNNLKNRLAFGLCMYRPVLPNYPRRETEWLFHVPCLRTGPISADEPTVRSGKKRQEFLPFDQEIKQ